MPKKLLISTILLLFLLIQPIIGLAEPEPEVDFESNPAGGMGFFRYAGPPGREHGAAYLMRGAGEVLWAAEEAIWLTAWDADEVQDPRGVHLKISFPNADPSVRIETAAQMPGYVSVLKGADSFAWQTELPLWGVLRYRGLYPGVDLVILSTENGFEWEYELGPGADPSMLRLSIEGAEGISQAGTGMTLATAVGDLSLPSLGLRSAEPLPATERAAFVSQEPGGLIEIYPQSVTETTSSTDPALRLWYSTLLGGSGRDEARKIAVDAQGNAYLSGTTWSVDFPTTPGAFDRVNNSDDAFVVKFNMGAGAPSLAYATYMGGSGQERATGLAVESGIAYVTGYTNSSDFPGAGPSAGENDIFVAALNATGSGLVYGRVIGGLDEDYGYSIAVSGGQAYVTGITYSSDFPKTTGPSYAGNGDVFILRLNSSGGISYARLWGTGFVDAGYSVVVSSGIAWVTGETNDNRNVARVFVISVSTNGSLSSEQFFGGGSDDFGYGIVIDSSNQIYITGLTFSSDFPVTNASSYGGNGDAFLVKMSSTGPPVFATYLGGAQNDRGSDIALDGLGGVLVTGYTFSDNFPVTSDAYQPTRGGNFDAFITRYQFSGSNPGVLDYSTYLGGSGREFGYGIAVHSGVLVYVTGLTRSANFPITANALYKTLNGLEDVFFSVIALGDLPSVQLEKRTNGANPGSPQDLYILTGSSVNWTYKVTNLGDRNVTNIAVVDDQGVVVTCPVTTLLPGAYTTCSGSGTAFAGPYSNVGTVTGVVDIGGTPIPVTASDDSHYFGVSPGVAVEFKVNGNNAESAPGVIVLPGSTLTLDYVVSNTGNVSLSSLVVTDSLGNTCNIASLGVGANQTCTRTTTALAGQQSASATVTGSLPGGLSTITSAPNWIYYLGAQPAISLEKKTNGYDADTPTGPLIKIGEPITWTFEVTNSGNVTLTGIQVTDNKLGAISCPESSLAAGANMTCSRGGTAVAGQHANLGTVTGTPPVGGNISDTDPSHYFGSDAGVTIQKLTNGVDTSTAATPHILVGQSVNWTYLVTNIGNLGLTGVAVTDSDPTLVVSCPGTTLAAGGTMTCTASGTAKAGSYSNTAYVEGTPSGFTEKVQNSHASGYIGANPVINITKYINGEHYPTTPGLKIDVGEPLVFTYQVSNPETLYRFTNILVADDSGLVPVCPKTTLNPGESMTCSVNGDAVAGQQSHVGRVTTQVLVHATSVVLGSIQNSSISHYFGGTGYYIYLPLILK